MRVRAAIGGAVLALAGLQLLAVEAIAASAWTTPRYSYAGNYISDLGVVGCPSSYGGRDICSPLAPIMDVSFVAEGLLFVLAAALLLGLSRSRWRWVFLGLAVLHGVGSALIGLFPETSSSGLHVPGAVLAIAGGDLAVIVAGIALRRHPLGRVVIALGVIGLAGAVLLETTDVAPDGVLERVGVYAITAFDVLVGIAAIGRSRAR